jgi:hypothetical protein
MTLFNKPAFHHALADALYEARQEHLKTAQAAEYYTALAAMLGERVTRLEAQHETEVAKLEAAR